MSLLAQQASGYLHTYSEVMVDTDPKPTDIGTAHYAQIALTAQFR